MIKGGKMEIGKEFKDFLIIESFKSTNNYKLISKKEMDDFWIEVLNSNIENIQGVYQEYQQMKAYEFKNQGREYFIYTFVKDNVLEVHFYDRTDMDLIDDLSVLKKTSTSLPVYSAIVSIVLKELEERPSRKVRIIAPDGREKLYLKIIEKILKDQNIIRTIKISSKKEEGVLKHYFLLENINTLFIEF